MTVVGFDFGTTNSLISVVRGGRVINFLDEDQRPIPSIVCYEGGQKVLGRDAKKRLEQAGLGIQGNIVRSPKMYLGKETIFVEGTEKNPVEIVADVVQHVHEQARMSGRDLGKISGAVVTIPVDMQGYRRRALRDAFKMAGLRIVQFVHEPLAALYGLFRNEDTTAMLRRFDKKMILVFDWGGGTLDLTLCRLMDGMVVQLLNDGTDEVGGDAFDEAIMNRLIQNVATARKLDAAPGIHNGAKARLLDRCERAKVDLSSRSNVAVYVSSFFRDTPDEELDYSLGQAELEDIVAPLLDKGFRRIDSLLESLGLAPEQVALCVATGGMSGMPIVKRRLHEVFGPERVIIPENTATLIAEGAAWIAADQAGLQLAKNIELVLARNSYLPLLKAGTEMPTEGQPRSTSFHLYCTDPRDGTAKFQICAPKRPGNSVLPNEPRTTLANVTVQVDPEARPFQERLELDLTIDDDLVLEVYPRSLIRQDKDRQEIHNLEFGIRLPTKGSADAATEEIEKEKFTGQRDTAGISVRANLADRIEPSLVPGEFLDEYDPHYFDVRRNPPRHQVEEKLYYQPCAACGRASNDPACRCSDFFPVLAKTHVLSEREA